MSEKSGSLEGSVRLVDVYKSFRPNEPVLRGVTLDFPAGQLTYILGSSGAGKSEFPNTRS